MRLSYLVLLWALTMAAVCYSRSDAPCPTKSVTPPTTVVMCHGPTCDG